MNKKKVINEFQTAKKIIFGNESLLKLHKEDIVKNAHKVCLITDKGLERVGILDKFTSLLVDKKIITYTDIEGEPTFQLVCEATNRIDEEKVDLIIGVGGGSALDVAKTVATLCGKDNLIDYYKNDKVIENREIKCILIPTTSGTGSEVTKNAIFGDEKEKVKKGVVSEHLLPDIALIDPELTMTCPPRVTAASGVDAFTHAIESYVATNASLHTKVYAEKAMRLFPEYIAKSVHNGKDISGREGMAWVSLFAGISLANAGVGAVHALAYPLGGEYGIEHGIANALLLPFVLNVVGKTCTDEMVEIAKYLKLGDFHDIPYEALEAIVSYLKKLLIDLNLPASLEELNVRVESLPSLAKSASEITRLLENTPYILKENQILEIYQKAFKGVHKKNENY